MKDKKKVVAGYILLFTGFALFYATTRFGSEMRFFSPISAGIAGACVVMGNELMERGRNPKLDKQKRIEQQDERNQLIRGKAAYIALCAEEIMVFIYGSYLMHIAENDTAGFICYGIAFASLAVFIIAGKLIARKM